MQQRAIRGPVIPYDVHSSGRSVAEIEGKKVYFDGTIPGEKITYTRERRKQGFRSGSMVECILPSPHRIDPVCRHYGTCGGCSWQHIDYKHQLELKRNILCNALAKYNIVTPEVPAVIPSPEIFHYRHRMEYAFSEDGILGFHYSGEPGKVIDIRECHLQAEPSRAICGFIQAYAVRQGISFYNHTLKNGLLRSLSIRVNREGEACVVIGISEPATPLSDDLCLKLQQAFPAIVSLNLTVHLSPQHSQQQGEIHPFDGSDPFFYEGLENKRFRMHASSFFQPNVLQAERIFRMARDWAGLRGTEKVYDLYTGVGTMALFLAAGAKHVTGIEGSEAAIQDARANAIDNKINNTEFLTGDILKTFTPEFLHYHEPADLIVLDPPRSGTLIEIKKTICGSGAARVIYLSCNPVSLAFDLKQLTEYYRVESLQPFDMLPQTHHLETLVILVRKE